MIYTLSASYAYNVNYYLGIRFLKERNETVELKWNSFMIYLMLCLCNLLDIMDIGYIITYIIYQVVI